jgi:hypothetical protein
MGSQSFPMTKRMLSSALIRQRGMNKKRKILTVVALAVFSVIILLHYGRPEFYNPASMGNTAGLPGLHFKNHEVIKDVRMPFFVLAVFYVGLFSLLGDKKN